MTRGGMRRLLGPGTIFIVFLVAVELEFGVALARQFEFPPRFAILALQLVAWVSGTMLFTRALEMAMWNRIGRKRGRKAPRLLIQLGNVFIYLAAAITMATQLFGISPTGAVATSSVIGLVIGFAVKSLISDTFSGIALNLDNGFGIGDFIRIMRPGTGPLIMGSVTEVNWRSTYLLTPENSMIVIPNTVISESIVLNMSRPSGASEFEIDVALDFDVAPERALRILTAVVQAASTENPAIFDGKARLASAAANGVIYKLIYMLDPTRYAPGKAKHQILRHLLRHLSVGGLAIAHPQLDSWTREPKAFDSDDAMRNRQRLLRQVELFRGLGDADIARIAARMAERRYAPGESVIVAGEPGRSMFVMNEGLVSVRLRAQDGDIDVAMLSPGDFFGEMSLLTGEPRSAAVVAITETTVFEVDKDDLAPVLEENPAAAEILSGAAADRKLASDQALLAGKPREIAKERASLAGKILASMSSFFGWRGKRSLTRERAA